MSSSGSREYRIDFDRRADNDDSRTTTRTIADLPSRVQSFAPSHVLIAADRQDEVVKREEVECRYIARVLEATGGHRTRTLQILGFDRRTLDNNAPIGLPRTGRTRPRGVTSP